MYITAHRVRSAIGESGINGFLYMHGPIEWPELPPNPDMNCGELVDAIEMVSQGGNAVHSFLDIVAPDGMLFEEIRTLLFQRFLTPMAAEGRSMPWFGTVDRCWFRMSMTSSMSKSWRSELSLLITMTKLVYEQGMKRLATRPAS